MSRGVGAQTTSAASAGSRRKRAAPPRHVRGFWVSAAVRGPSGFPCDFGLAIGSPRIQGEESPYLAADGKREHLPTPAGRLTRSCGHGIFCIVEFPTRNRSWEPWPCCRWARPDKILSRAVRVFNAEEMVGIIGRAPGDSGCRQWIGGGSEADGHGSQEPVEARDRPL